MVTCKKNDASDANETSQRGRQQEHMLKVKARKERSESEMLEEGEGEMSGEEQEERKRDNYK